MNETPSYFVIPRSSTTDKKKRTEGPSQDYKCQASSFVSPAFYLPPLQIFKNLENFLPGEYPFGMQILAFKSRKRKDP